jgi:hypothetical protein
MSAKLCSNSFSLTLGANTTTGLAGISTPPRRIICIAADDDVETRIAAGLASEWFWKISDLSTTAELAANLEELVIDPVIFPRLPTRLVIESEHIVGIHVIIDCPSHPVSSNCVRIVYPFTLS